MALGGSQDGAFLREIVPGVYGWMQPDGTWWVNNAGAITGDDAGRDGVVLVDTCATEQRTRRFLRAVAEATGGAPIRAAVNTHQHGDHYHGNGLLPRDAVVIAHAATRAAQLVDPVIDGCPPFWQPVPDWGAVTRRVADVVVRKDLAVFTGRRRVEVIHPGYPAHTPGDVVVWLPEERVLFTGDLLFHGLTPLVVSGSVAGALRVLDWIGAFRPAYVVPGHGPLITGDDLPGVLGAHERYYTFVRESAHEGRREGLSALDTARRTDLGEFGRWPDAERLVLNLHRAYADAEETEVDLIAAFTDAVTFNGGPLPTSV